MEKNKKTGKWKQKVPVISQECLASGVYSMWIEAADMAAAARAGQFFSVHEGCQPAAASSD